MQFWEPNTDWGLERSPPSELGPDQTSGPGNKLKRSMPTSWVISFQKAYGVNFIRSVRGGGFEEGLPMWKIGLSCKKPNQTTVATLGMIKAKEEPAAASSAAYRSPHHAGSLLAEQNTGMTGGGSCLHLPQEALNSEKPQKWINSSQTWDKCLKKKQNFYIERSAEERTMDKGETKEEERKTRTKGWEFKVVRRHGKS